MYHLHHNHLYFRLKKNGGLQVICLLTILILLPLTCTAQAKEDLSSHYNWFDTIIGIENLEMHYGAVYVEKHRAKSKKSKFFPSPYFTLGDVVIDNLPYYSLNLKYNVYEDELLMQVANKFGGKVLQLYKGKISSFTIADHRFIKIGNPETNDKQINSGFYEVFLEKPSFTLLKKYRRLLTEQLGANLVFYEFEELDPEFVIHYKDAYYRLKKMEDIKVLFPENTVQLNNFIKSQPSNLSFEDQLKSTFLFIDTLLNEE
jgi:hypothetical protein